MKQFLAALANPGADELSQDLERCRTQYGARFEHVGQIFSNDEFMADESNHNDCILSPAQSMDCLQLME